MTNFDRQKSKSRQNNSRRQKHTATQPVLRIVGGRHRGRKLPVPDLPGLRPTGDRVRETLFNWLQFELPGMNVLDLFAGTGALGLEALSREANHAVFVEQQASASRAINASLNTLAMTNAEVVTMSALDYLNGPANAFDLVFLDPPFHDNLWDQTLTALVSRGWLNEQAYVYVEQPKSSSVEIPEQLSTVKDKTTGQVRYRLLTLR